eukprot:6461698-Lingulodinium_polyedra.AAC.1
MLARRVRVPADILESVTPGRAVLFTLDLARLHVASPVVRARRQHGLMFHLVPARMTCLLQPCGARVFATYRRRLQEALVARQLGIMESIQGNACGAREFVRIAGMAERLALVRRMDAA